MLTRDDLFRHAAETYGDTPEYLWQRDPRSCVLRHPQNARWYAVFLSVAGSKLGLKDNSPVDIMDIKLPPDDTALLTAEQGLIPAYHMNKKHWLTVVLDGSGEDTLVLHLLQKSWEITR